MSVGEFIDDLARAVGFLSRLPAPARHFAGHDGRLSRTVRAFPAAGIVIVLPAALFVLMLAFLAAPPLVSAVLVVGTQVFLAGALHEDGLADTADGLGAGHERSRALDIMKDSRSGVYGVVALVLSLILRVAAIASLLAVMPALAFALALLAVAAFSRAAMVWHWHRLPPARPDGVAVAAGAPEPAAARTALLSGSVVALILLWIASGPLAALATLLVAAATWWLFTTRTRTRLGGHTGDTIGATQQCVEMAALATLAILL